MRAASLRARSLRGTRSARSCRSTRCTRSSRGSRSARSSSLRVAVLVNILGEVCLAEGASLHHDATHHLDGLAALWALMSAAIGACWSEAHIALSLSSIAYAQPV